MSLLSLFSFVVYAAELIISPIPPGEDVVIRKPQKTFGMLAQAVESPGFVLGEENISSSSGESPVLSPPDNHTSTPSAVITPRKTSRIHYTVAVLGDSMVDTLGPGIPHLQAKLDQVFPQTDFTLLNYGVGATNIEYGLERITKDYTYLEKQIPSLVSQHPDIVVVESFGYNPFPFDDGALDKHWLTMGTIIDTLRNQIPGVIVMLAATVAPDSGTFGDNAPGISFDQQSKNQRTSTIKKYLQSTVNFATSQKIPLADAYTPSMLADGNGNPSYINQGDHIHPSDAGKTLFAEKIVGTLVDNGLLE